MIIVLAREFGTGGRPLAGYEDSRSFFVRSNPNWGGAPSCRLQFFGKAKLTVPSGP